MVILNGLIHENRIFDSKVTFYRGSSTSQIDICLTNNVKIVDELKILDKTPVSDHCPMILSLHYPTNCSYDIINECAKGFLSYDHFDLNKKLRKTTRVEKCDLAKLYKELEDLGNELLPELETDMLTRNGLETLNKRITDGIYTACRRSKRKHTPIHVTGNLLNCDSKHFKAIADANAMNYRRLHNDNDPRALHYRELWLHFQELSYQKEEEEYLQDDSKQWKELSRENPKKMWELIDWSNKDKGSKEDIPPLIIEKFFKNIFQSETTLNHPQLQEAEERITRYVNKNDVTDKDISEEEIKKASLKMKRWY